MVGWIEQGVAHWFRRRLYPEQLCFDVVPPDLPIGPRKHAWEAKVRARVEQQCAITADDLLGWPPDRPRSYVEHFECWSRIDYLAHAGKLGAFLRGVKGPGYGRGGRSVEEEMVMRVRLVLLHECGLKPEQFDEEWRRFVLATYARN